MMLARRLAAQGSDSWVLLTYLSPKCVLESSQRAQPCDDLLAHRVPK